MEWTGWFGLWATFATLFPLVHELATSRYFTTLTRYGLKITITTDNDDR